MIGNRIKFLFMREKARVFFYLKKESPVFYFSIFFVIYVMIQIPPYILPAYIPDEYYYHSYNFNHKILLEQVGIFKYYFMQPNTIGYGGLYWTVFLFFYLNVGNSLLAMRLFSLLLCCAIPLVLLWQGTKNKSPLKYFSAFFWMSFPVAWWYGKMVGPEIFSLFLAILGLHFAIEFTAPVKKRYLGWILLGMSIGIKVHNIPLFTYASTFLMYEFWKDPKKWKEHLVFPALFFVFGFIASNPVVVFDFQTFLSNMMSVKRTSSFNWTFFKEILSNQEWEWDLVKKGGLFQWSLGFIPFLLFTILLIFSSIPRIVSLAIFFSFFSVSTLIMSSSRFVAWYWFPFIYLFPLAILAIKNTKKWEKKFVYGIFLLNFFYAIPEIKSEYANKLSHYLNMIRAENVTPCIANYLANREKYNLIYNYSDFDLPTDYDAYLAKNGVTLQIMQAGGSVNSGKIIENYQQKRVLILMGDRFAKVFHQNNFEATINEKINPLISKGGEIVKIGRCSPIDIYEYASFK